MVNCMRMNRLKTILLLATLALFSGCNRGYISVRQEWIDGRYLASTHVGTPDPRQAHPPLGQKLVLNWWVPREVLNKNPRIVLTLLFWNYTEQTVTYPIDNHAGYKTYSLLNEEYEKMQGLLTYRAEIVTDDDKVFAEWKHQLWVRLIDINKEPYKREVPRELTPAPEPKKDFGIIDDDENFFSKQQEEQKEESEEVAEEQNVSEHPDIN